MSAISVTITGDTPAEVATRLRAVADALTQQSSVVGAASLVSGAARRDRDHDVAWRAHLASSEAWDAAREAARLTAFQAAYDASERQGRGSAAAAAAGHEAARVAVHDFERRAAPPAFDGVETSPRLFTQMKSRVREAAVR